MTEIPLAKGVKVSFPDNLRLPLATGEFGVEIKALDEKISQFKKEGQQDGEATDTQTKDIFQLQDVEQED